MNNRSLSTKKYKIGLVISEGGIRSLAALPLISFLSSLENVEITCISGCGGGAALAGLYALKYPEWEIISSMKELFDPINFSSVNYISVLKNIFQKKPKKVYGLLSNTLLYGKHHKFFDGKLLEEMQPKILIQTSNILTSKGITLSNGNLADSIFASNAYYPFIPPIEIETNWLGAGFFISSLPILGILQEDVNLIIAVDASLDTYKKNTNNMIEYSINFFGHMFSKSQKHQIAIAIHSQKKEVILTNIKFKKQINFWDVCYIEEIINAGKEALAHSRSSIEESLK